MPPNGVDSFGAYCQLLATLKDMPLAVADPIAAASRMSLHITHAQHCAASEQVFGSFSTKAQPRDAAKPKPAAAAKARPAARMSVAYPGGRAGAARAGGAADPLLWQRVSVYWPDYNGWFEGVVTAVDAAGMHCTLYGFGTDNEEVSWHDLRQLPAHHIRQLGPASAALVAQIAALQRGEDPAAVVPAPAPVAACKLPVGEMSWEQLEAKLEATQSVSVVDGIAREVAARKAAIQARLAELGDSDGELE